MESLIGINKESLDKNQYLVSLVNEGVRAGLLEPELISDMPSGLLEILKDNMRMYTKGESDTLKVETAEGLMSSIIYSISLYLMKFGAPEDAVSRLKSTDIKTVYREAMDYIKSYVEETKNLYKSIEAKRISVPNVIYSETFEAAIPKFFSGYDVIFSAQDTSSDMDYPLVFDDMSLKGIIYVRRYLEAFELENDLCRKFNPQDITAMLKLYGKRNRIDYELTPVNLFELVFNNIVFLALLDRGYDDLLISAVEFELITERLNGLTVNELGSLVSEALNKVIASLEITNPNLVDLMRRHSKSLIVRIDNALKHGNLINIVIVDTEINNKDYTILKTGRKMNDKYFRVLYRRIMDCPTVEEKISLMNKCVHSFGDFVDLLKADCFYGKEYGHVFENLGNLELSALIGLGLREYISTDDKNLSKLFSDNIGFKYDWQRALIDWLRGLDKERLREIETLTGKW